MSPLALALLSAALWGGTDLVTTYVGRRIGSLRVVVIAVSTSLVLAGGVAIARGLLTQDLDPLIVVATLAMGVGAGISYIAVFTAFRLGPLSVVSPTISAYGALSAFIAAASALGANLHLTNDPSTGEPGKYGAAEIRRAAAVALEQEMRARVEEMRARVVEAERHNKNFSSSFKFT